MDQLFCILVGLGLAASCGFRVFLPMFVAGLAMHTGHLTPASEFAWLGSTSAMIVLGTATALEIAGYYVPWIDHALDTVATPASVVAGTLLMGSVVTDMDPWLRWTAAVIAGGGVAGAVQAGTVALRGLSLTTTGGLGNPVVATAELGGALLTSSAAVLVPGAAFLGMLAVSALVVTVLVRRRSRNLKAAVASGAVRA